MNNGLDEQTIKAILEQLTNLNRNLSTGNILGGDNRLFNRGGGGSGIMGKVRQNKVKELEDDIETYRAIIKDKSYSKDRRQARRDLWQTKNDLFQVSGKAQMVAGIQTAVKSISNIIFSVLETQIKKQGIKLQAASELQTRAIQTYGKALNNAISVQIGNVTGTVLDTAYQSLNAVIDGGRSIYMKNLSDAITIRKKENELYRANVEMAGGIVESAGSALAGFGGIVGAVGSTIALAGSISKRAFMVKVAQTELEIKQSEFVKQAQDEWMQQIESVVKSFADMSKQVTKSFMEAGNSAYNYGRTLGISGNALRQYHDAIIEGINTALSEFAMDYTDYAKMTTSYENANGGRVGILATREAMLLGGLSKRLGISAEEASTITGSMNIFNTSIADGSEMIYQMSKVANKMGLSATRFAKDLEKNLKLAEKYQFRGGVKGLMEMSLWAQKTRFNIDSITNLIEKGLNGNIEDVIQTSARLNVLGGNAAMFSDPMGILYDAMDPMAMAKRVNNMIQGYGIFDSATGETIFNRVEMMRMQAMAQAMGMSREDLMNQARQVNKRSAIMQRYGGRFGQEKTDFLTQHATWSREKNDWVIKVNSPTAPGGFEEMALSELNGQNINAALENIFPEDKQDRLLDYVLEIRNFLSASEQQLASDKYATSMTMAVLNRRGMIDTLVEMAREKRLFTDTNSERNADMVIRFNKAALEAQRKMNRFTTEGGAETLVASYLEFTAEQNDELLKETREYVDSNQKIKDKLDEIAEVIVQQATPEQIEARRKYAEFNRQNWDEIQRIINRNYWYMTRSQKNEMLNNLYNGRAVIGKNKLNGSGIYYKRDYEGNWTNSEIPEGFARPSFTTPTTINDAVITPRGAVYTHPDDMIAAFKPNGDILRGLNGGTSKLEVSGTLRLDANGQSIDLIELIRNNPDSMRRLTEQILVTASGNAYGGRSIHAPNRYTIPN